MGNWSKLAYPILKTRQFPQSIGDAGGRGRPGDWGGGDGGIAAAGFRVEVKDPVWSAPTPRSNDGVPLPRLGWPAGCRASMDRGPER